MIRTGMIVRTPDGARLGEVGRIGDTDFAIAVGARGPEYPAPFTAVIAVDDERGELICRPLDLPWLALERSVEG